jgi:hypothetical protein
MCLGIFPQLTPSIATGYSGSDRAGVLLFLGLFFIRLFAALDLCPMKGLAHHHAALWRGIVQGVAKIKGRRHSNPKSEMIRMGNVSITEGPAMVDPKYIAVFEHALYFENRSHEFALTNIIEQFWRRIRFIGQHNGTPRLRSDDAINAPQAADSHSSAGSRIPESSSEFDLMTFWVGSAPSQYREMLCRSAPRVRKVDSIGYFFGLLIDNDFNRFAVRLSSANVWPQLEQFTPIGRAICNNGLSNLLMGKGGVDYGGSGGSESENSCQALPERLPLPVRLFVSAMLIAVCAAYKWRIPVRGSDRLKCPPRRLLKGKVPSIS